MTAGELIQHVQSVGGRIRVDGEHIRIQAPKGMISAELAERLRERKAEIIRRLELVTRLSNLGISIAIDSATKAAFLAFSESDVEAVRHVATIYKPSEAPLNEEQCRLLLEDLNYYEKLSRRAERQREKGHFRRNWQQTETF
jgi:hypothetical protein